MNKYKHQLKELFHSLKRQAARHSDVLASVSCGALMGILFMTAIARYEARRAIPLHYQYRGMPLAQYLGIRESPSTESSESSASSHSKNLKPAAPISSGASRRAPVPSSSASPVSSLSSSASVSNTSSTVTISSRASSKVSSSASSSASLRRAASDFPAFTKSSFPVARVPNWGVMRSPAEWDRTHSQMTAADFVAIPRYDLKTLTIPMDSLINPLRDENIPAITAKLFYSTRYRGSYDLDAGEHTGDHAGVDLKLARGTPVGAIGGGRVSGVEKNDRLGLHVIVEHRLKNGETYYSIYAHLDTASLSVGQDVVPGQQVGNVGMTGKTTAAHLHLQIDTGSPGEAHVPSQDAATMVNPISFIGRYRNGE